MKIDRSSLRAPAAAPRRGERTRSSGTGFAEALGGGDTPQRAKVAPNAQVTGLDALLALQEVPETSGGREEARQQGERLLDRLDELRMDLLEGKLSPQSVQRLAAEVETAQRKSDDPQLNEILDEIELRAHVELAKLGL